MYGYEAQTGRRGGLAAQAPGGDLYFPQALAIQPNAAAIIGGDPTYGPPGVGYNALNTQGFSGLLASGAAVSGNGMAVEQPVASQQAHWSSVLDFHNSVAPWILIGILVLYGWLHVSVRARAGRMGAAAVL